MGDKSNGFFSAPPVCEDAERRGVLFTADTGGMLHRHICVNNTVSKHYNTHFRILSHHLNYLYKNNKNNT